MANKIYHISIQSVFFTTTLTAEEGRLTPSPLVCTRSDIPLRG